MKDYAIKFEHVSKIYKLKKKNDGKIKSNEAKRFYAKILVLKFLKVK